MSRGESERRPSDAAPSSGPVENGRETEPQQPPKAASEKPGALRRFGGGIAERWRRVGGLSGLLTPVADGARWLYRNRSRIATGVRRFGEILVAILKTAARVGAVLVRMGEALARLEEQRAAKPVGRGRRGAARAGAGLSRFGRRLDDFGRGLLPVADGIEDIGEHLESAAPGDATPLPPALPDPTPPAAPSRASEPAPDPAPPKVGAAPAGRASSPPPAIPPAIPEAAPAVEPEAPEPAAPPPVAVERPAPARRSATAPPKTPRAPDADNPAAALPKELLARIRGLRPRPGRATMETLIEDICRAREWSTTAELSAILGRDSRSLNRTYLKPMAAAGRLVRRYPDRFSHPDQAFRAAK